MYGKIKTHLQNELDEIKSAGLHKNERIINGPQSATISAGGKEVLNLCANNYLGLSSNHQVIEEAKKALDDWGYGMSSVRFICGTQDIHKTLESKISIFLGMDDTILYTSCFDANGGLFETILGPEDAVISDELNHASIIDGVRLCKAKRYRYKNSDMNDLEEQLKSAKDARHRLIVTDGVFSMDGYIANLEGVCNLADKYDAIVMVDDSHAVGFMGETGRGTHELCNVMDRVDIITGTLGKALGGASGGYTSARQEIINILRQRSRPYLFSNTVAPSIVAASIKVIDLLSESNDLINKLKENTRFFREEMDKIGLEVLPGTHPIVPVMFGEARPAVEMSEKLLEKGIYVVAFSYPVVPKGKARIRVQISAAHTKAELEYTVKMFSEAKEELGI